VREAKGEGTAQLLDHLKKGEMASEAAQLLKGSGWLPEVLCRADLVASDGEGIADGQGEDAGGPEEVDLPAFLTADLPDGNLGGRTACLSATCSSPSVPSGGSSSARDMQAGS